MYFFLLAVALPHVAAYKHSEHGNEKDKGVMVCVSHGYPLPTDWTWFKEQDGTQKVCISQTYHFDKFKMIHMFSKPEEMNPNFSITIYIVMVLSLVNDACPLLQL